MVELFEEGACAVLVPLSGLDDWPVEVRPVEDGDCDWAEFVEGLAADPEDELDGAEDDGEGVDVDSC